MNKKNTPHLWDKIWEKETLNEFDKDVIKKEESSIRWKRIKDKVHQQFGTFENLKVIEIGAGKGTYAALMAKHGAEVTVVDYSEKALIHSQTFFKQLNLKAQFVNNNALSPSKDLIGKFDISMSFGLAEHFMGDDRFKIIKTHFDLINNNGITFISVPNKNNIFYIAYKFLAEKRNRWVWGEEYPFSRRELSKICKIIKPTTYSFFGDSFTDSFRFIPKIGAKINFEKKQDKGTFLDAYFSYALVLYAKK